MVENDWRRSGGHERRWTRVSRGHAGREPSCRTGCMILRGTVGREPELVQSQAHCRKLVTERRGRFLELRHSVGCTERYCAGGHNVGSRRRRAAGVCDGEVNRRARRGGSSVGLNSRRRSGRWARGNGGNLNLKRSGRGGGGSISGRGGDSGSRSSSTSGRISLTDSPLDGTSRHRKS